MLGVGKVVVGDEGAGRRGDFGRAEGKDEEDFGEHGGRKDIELQKFCGIIRICVGAMFGRFVIICG